MKFSFPHSYMLRIFEIYSILNEATRTNTDHRWRCFYFNGATFSNWLSVDWCSQVSDFICTLRGVILKVRTWLGIVVQLFKENIIIKRKENTLLQLHTDKHGLARACTVLYTVDVCILSPGTAPSPSLFHTSCMIGWPGLLQVVAEVVSFSANLHLAYQNAIITFRNPF